VLCISARCCMGWFAWLYKMGSEHLVASLERATFSPYRLCVFEMWENQPSPSLDNMRQRDA